MAKNTGKGGRVGSVSGRTQFKTSSGHSAKRDAATGRIMAVKTSDKTPFKGVAKENDGRRS
jgi:hypothetical protein